MNLNALCEALPEYAADLATNLRALASEQLLTSRQLQGTFLACACAVGEPRTIRAVSAAVEGLDESARAGAKGAAAAMALSNVYHRALHQLSNEAYRRLPAGLRTGLLRDRGVLRVEYELWAFAVSAIHGCGACLDAHEAELRRHGLEARQIQAALRVAAAVHAVGRTLAVEAAMNG